MQLCYHRAPTVLLLGHPTASSTPCSVLAARREGGVCVPNLSFMIILFWERYQLATMHFLIYSRLSFFTRECTWLTQGVFFPNISIQPMVGQQIALTTPLSGQICHVCAPSPSPAFCFQALHLPPASQERKQIYFPSANLFRTKCLALIFPVLQPPQDISAP